MDLSVKIILAVLALAMIICLCKIFSIIHNNHKLKIDNMKTQIWNTAVMQENANFRAKFFAKCAAVREMLLKKTNTTTIRTYLIDHGIESPMIYFDDLCDSVARYVLSHMDTDVRLTEIFAVAGLMRILIMCDEPSVTHDYGTEEAWFKYTRHGDDYPKDSLTRYLGSMEVSNSKLDRLYYLVDTLFFDLDRFDEFVDGRWMHHAFDLDNILHEVDSRPFITPEIASQFDDIRTIELREVDRQWIKDFITNVIKPQMD